MQRSDSAPKFSPGRIVATPGALASIPNIEILSALRRHLSGDWGDLCAEDKKLNDRALTTEGRLLSAYHSVKKVKFYLITEWDRSITTVLLPSEY